MRIISLFSLSPFLSRKKESTREESVPLSLSSVRWFLTLAREFFFFFFSVKSDLFFFRNFLKITRHSQNTIKRKEREKKGRRRWWSLRALSSRASPRPRPIFSLSVLSSRNFWWNLCWCPRGFFCAFSRRAWFSGKNVWFWVTVCVESNSRKKKKKGTKTRERKDARTKTRD